MINEERVKVMTRMEAFEQADGKKSKPMAEYYRKDYVAMEMLISIITGTIGFGLLLVVWVLLGKGVEQWLYQIDIENLGATIWPFAWRYLLFMLFYLTISFFYYNHKYTVGRKKIKQYYQDLLLMEKLYSEEEQQTKPTGGIA